MTSHESAVGELNGSMRVELRPATPDDGQLVYEVTEAAMRRYVEQAFGPWIESFQREVIAKSFDPATHRVVLIDGREAGLVAVGEHASHLQLEKIYLLPHCQRHGVGSRLLKQIVESAAKSGKPVRLRVLAVNTDARRWYERFGFVVTKATAERLFMEYRADRMSA
jgi:ribosomal protein S18 acetylase RimI-like enzyme